MTTKEEREDKDKMFWSFFSSLAHAPKRLKCAGCTEARGLEKKSGMRPQTTTLWCIYFVYFFFFAGSFYPVQKKTCCPVHLVALSREPPLHLHRWVCVQTRRLHEASCGTSVAHHALRFSSLTVFRDALAF